MKSKKQLLEFIGNQEKSIKEIEKFLGNDEEENNILIYDLLSSGEIFECRAGHFRQLQ